MHKEVKGAHYLFMRNMRLQLFLSNRHTKQDIFAIWPNNAGPPSFSGSTITKKNVAAIGLTANDIMKGSAARNLL